MVARDLLVQFDRYLTGRTSLRDLEGWLVSNLQQILDSGDETAIQAANQIDVDLVEFGEGLIDEATLVERIASWARLVETVSVNFPESIRLSSIKAGANAETFKNRVEVSRPVVDLRLRHAFA